MRYLIDTNVLANYVTEGYISNDVEAIISNCENQIYVSSECLKEFIHLVQAGKIVLKKELRSLDVFDLVENVLGFNVKFVTKEHLRTLAKLETVEGHSDPSDRLIIAQAITENIPLISSDTKFPKYIQFGLDFIPNR